MNAPFDSTMAAALACAAFACAPPIEPVDPHLDPVRLDRVEPALLLPGTTARVRGAGFLSPEHGGCALRVRADGVDARLPARWISDEELSVTIDEGAFAALAGPGRLRGAARVEVDHEALGLSASSAPARVELELSRAPAFEVTSIEAPRAIHVDDAITVFGGGMRLGGAEGSTRARLWGCFYPGGDLAGGCRAVPSTEATLEVAPDRAVGAFRLAPEILGVEPGVFRGSVAVRDVAPDGEALVESAPWPLELEVLPPVLRAVTPARVSYGQWIFLEGAGLPASGATVLELRARFEEDGAARELTQWLVPEPISPGRFAYALGDTDGLGRAIHFRQQSGRLTGTLSPVVRHDGVEVRGAPAPLSLEVAPVRQIVHLTFHPSFGEALRRFGLRAALRAVEARVVDEAAEAYRGVGLELRTEVPEDFAIYAHVDLAGPDPNGQGLFGYDNTPGKDVHNQRLHDRIGGVDATTQADGSPGYGGVFLESFLGFSEHPPDAVRALPSATPVFDAVFDPFRPDAGGRPVEAAELEGLPDVARGRRCLRGPDEPRALRIACAIWALGSAVGSTLAHEIGHSLGLANPWGEGFHNPGDRPDRLMDAGSARPFEERARLLGRGPAVFCDTEYEYLREILPGEPGSDVARPRCL